MKSYFKIIAFILIVACLVVYNNKKADTFFTKSDAKGYAKYEMLINTNFQYWYKGEVIRIVDGDTIDIKINLGMDVSIVKRIRMAGINAPELSDKPNGEYAKTFLENLLKSKYIILHTRSDSTDRYGRFLATVFIEKTLENVNDEMIKSGNAQIY